MVSIDAELFPGRAYEFESGYHDVPKVITLLFSIYVIEWYLELGVRIKALGAIRFEFVLGVILG